MSKIRDFTTSYNQKNILGTVSQVAGVPTGAILETGSNGNGCYIKYTDGTLLCHHAINESITTVTGNKWGATSGNGFRAADSVWYFPVTFAWAPRCWASPAGMLDHGGVSAHLSNISTIGAVRRVWSFASSTIEIHYFAIGRWY